MLKALNTLVLRRLSPFNIQNRCLVETSSRVSVPQGGSLEIDFSDTHSSIVKVDVVSQWQDHIDISHEGDVSYEVNEELQLLSVKGGSSNGSVRVITPESINVYINANNIDLNLENKIEGDIYINCKSGNVSVDKVRGMEVAMDCGKAVVQSKKLIEGDKVTLKCAEFKGKMVNGEDVDLEATDGGINIDAVYANKIAAKAAGDVTIDLLNGESNIFSSDGTVKVSNIDGAFKIGAGKGNILLQVNALMRGNTSWTASGCSVVSERGGIQISMDPEVRATVDARCLGVAGRALVSVISDSFEEYSHLVGTESGGPVRQNHRQGQLTGLSLGAKRPEFRSSSGRSSGKINLPSAENQSLQQTMSKTKEKSSPTEAVVLREDCEHNAPGFDLTLRSHGHIRLETLSWVEIIRRKHGFGDSDSAGIPPKVVGRTASSGQRAASILEESRRTK